MTELKKSDFYFDLPKELIAQDPLADRASSRLLCLDKHTGATSHHVFREVVNYLKPGDCLVLNNTKVIPARLYGVKEDTGAAIEVLLLKRKEDNQWETLVRPGKKCKPGTRLVFGEGLLHAQVLDVLEEGNRLIRFEYDGIFEEILDQLGEMPLPHTSHISCRTKTDIRPYMPSTREVLLRRQQDCILRKNCLPGSKKWV